MPCNAKCKQLVAIWLSADKKRIMTIKYTKKIVLKHIWHGRTGRDNVKIPELD